MIPTLLAFSGKTLTMTLPSGPTTLLLEDLIQTGSNGAVYRARALLNPRIQTEPMYYAVKATACKGHQDPSWFAHRLAAEIALHSRVSSVEAGVKHTGIVTYYDVREDSETGTVFLVLDYVPGGDLFEHVATRRPFFRNNILLKSVVLQILDALTLCHEVGVYHRDIKPENVLVSKDGRKAYLSDFGLATAEPTTSEFGVGTMAYISPGSFSSSPSKKYRLLTIIVECLGFFGTHAPFASRPHDIWAVGITLLFLLTGCNAWARASPTESIFADYLAHPKTFFSTTFPVSSGAERVLRAVLHVDPRKRATLSEVREMVKDVDEWWMSPEELADAPEGVQEIAEEYAKVPEGGKPGSPYASPLLTRSSYFSVDEAKDNWNANIYLVDAVVQDRKESDTLSFDDCFVSKSEEGSCESSIRSLDPWEIGAMVSGREHTDSDEEVYFDVCSYPHDCRNHNHDDVERVDEAYRMESLDSIVDWERILEQEVVLGDEYESGEDAEEVDIAYAFSHTRPRTRSCELALRMPVWCLCDSSDSDDTSFYSDDDDSSSQPGGENCKW